MEKELTEEANSSEKDLRDWIKGARGIPEAKNKTSFITLVQKLNVQKSAALQKQNPNQLEKNK